MEHQTRVVAVDPLQPGLKALQEAATILNNSGLVAIPTETVYGLAANALDKKAISQVFEAKGRPGNNPLIIHVAAISQAKELVKAWPPMAQNLAETFWPGPLTMVLEGNGRVPEIATAQGTSIAIRIPSHAVARSLIQLVGFPLAAPSANASGSISPTCATHVIKDLGGKIDMILDAGPTEVGIESTVVDLRSEPVRVLRPGIISAGMLREVVGNVECSTDAFAPQVGTMASPGMLEKHYAPRTLAIWVEGNLLDTQRECREKGLTFSTLALEKIPGAFCLGVDPGIYARNLYGALHTLDDMRLDRILVVPPPDTDAWAAVRDRLRRATVRL